MPPKSDAAVVRDRDDLEMLKRPHLWPGPVLCLKRRIEPADLAAYGWSNDFGRLRQDTAGTWVVLRLDAGLMPLELVPYESPEAIVADGWRVD